MLSLLLVFAAQTVAAPPAATPSDAAARPLRVVLLGGTFVERAQEFGEWETAARIASVRPLRVRNLAWSGDTVWAESRGRFDPADVAYQRLIDEVDAVRPDVIVFGYGTAEVLAGRSVAEFREQLTGLVDDLPDAVPVFLGTNRTALEALPEPARDELRKRFDAFDSAIAETAKARRAAFVAIPPAASDDRVQPNASGYRTLAAAIGPAIAAASGPTRSDPATPERREKVREAIVRKSRLVFHRHRPQNTTYLLLFRKHEQGQNAGEIEAFEQPIAEAETAIDALIAESRGG